MRVSWPRAFSISTSPSAIRSSSESLSFCHFSPLCCPAAITPSSSILTASSSPRVASSSVRFISSSPLVISSLLLVFSSSCLTASRPVHTVSNSLFVFFSSPFDSSSSCSFASSSLSFVSIMAFASAIAAQIEAYSLRQYLSCWPLGYQHYPIRYRHGLSPSACQQLL